MNNVNCANPWNELFNDMPFRSSAPSVNIRETENGFHLELAAPGLVKEDFKVKMENQVLSISVKKENKQEVNEGKYTRKEFSFQSFDRSFKLPDTVDADKIGAKYENGVLFLELPFRDAAKAKPNRDISVN
jgi:HSP20 family protein